MKTDLRPGVVLRYPYLWHWQDIRGESEGRKDRPTTIAAAFIARDNRHYVLLLPVTTQPPAPERIAVEVPATEKKRAGLDLNRQQWILLDEYNLDPIATSYYLQGSPQLGQFSDAFMRLLLTHFKSLLPQAKRITRYP
ncbi:hypothetical protein [Acetobacter vaccinii]|uniref:hypothetical protein n=1 Tax=Acetobacter vaccinii TaxID=2592655 RepID=UPI001FEF65EC|nr:hypothetical protein [Acetobacter vaccinii]